MAYPIVIPSASFDDLQKNDHRPRPPGAVTVQCDRASAWKVRGSDSGTPEKIAKRKLDRFFELARDSMPKPHAHCVVAVLGVPGANRIRPKKAPKGASLSLPAQAFRQAQANNISSLKPACGTPPCGCRSLPCRLARQKSAHQFQSRWRFWRV